MVAPHHIIKALEHTKTWLEETGWAQGCFETSLGSLCIFGAVNRSILDREVLMATLDELTLTAGGRTNSRDHWPLVAWNDHPKRTYTQVVTLIDSTIRRMKMPRSVEVEQSLSNKSGRPRGPVKNDCPHKGMIWDPPVEAVTTVRCKRCSAAKDENCTRGSKQVMPCAKRYIEHHALNCGHSQSQHWARNVPNEYSKGVSL